MRAVEPEAELEALPDRRSERMFRIRGISATNARAGLRTVGVAQETAPLSKGHPKPL